MADPTYTYTWGFQGDQALEYNNGDSKSNDLDKGCLVTTVHWEVICTSSDGYTSRIYGAESFEKGSSMTAFDDLTKDTVIGWLKTKFGSDDVTEKEAALKADIVLQRTPTKISGQPTSWAS